MHYLTPALISALGWGVIPIMDRYNLQFVNTITLVALRAIIFSFVGIAIGITAFHFKQLNFKEGYKKGGKLLLFMIFISPVISYGLGHIGFYKALSLSKSSVLTITLISYGLPIIIVAILSTCIFGDKINLKMCFGIFLTLVGVTITILANPNHPPPKFLNFLFRSSQRKSSSV